MFLLVESPLVLPVAELFDLDVFKLEEAAAVLSELPIIQRVFVPVTSNGRDTGTGEMEPPGRGLFFLPDLKQLSYILRVEYFGQKVAKWQISKRGF